MTPSCPEPMPLRTRLSSLIDWFRTQRQLHEMIDNWRKQCEAQRAEIERLRKEVTVDNFTRLLRLSENRVSKGEVRLLCDGLGEILHGINGLIESATIYLEAVGEDTSHMRGLMVGDAQDFLYCCQQFGLVQSREEAKA